MTRKPSSERPARSRGRQTTGRTADAHGSATPSAKPDDAAPAADDNALESIGKAVSAPVLGAADEDPEAPPSSHDTRGPTQRR